MKQRRIYIGVVFAGLLAIAVLGAITQLVRGRRPLLLAGA
jgi:hypothetical protein